MVSSFLVDSHGSLGFGGVDISCSFLSRTHKEPSVVELTEYTNEAEGSADLLSVSDDGSLEDVEVEEKDMMLPSLDAGDSATDPISLPPMKMKNEKSCTRRVSLDTNQCAPSSQASLGVPAPAPLLVEGNSQQLVLPIQANDRINDAMKLNVPVTTTTHDFECHQVDEGTEICNSALFDDVVEQDRVQEFFSALRQFADTMKRSEYSRREVILGRRRLRHMYQELGGLDHLLSGEPWGRSVDYQLARRELVSEIYGQLLRRYSSHPVASESELFYTDGL
jgi:hypothetical protein